MSSLGSQGFDKVFWERAWDARSFGVLLFGSRARRFGSQGVSFAPEFRNRPVSGPVFPSFACLHRVFSAPKPWKRKRPLAYPNHGAFTVFLAPKPW